MNTVNTKISDLISEEPTSIYTPGTSIHDTWETPSFAVPRGGEKFIIYLKGTNKAITNVNGEPLLEEVVDTTDKRVQWFCVERNNWIGFQSIESFLYLNHDGGDRMVANGPQFSRYEYMVPRHHPDGDYQLLSPVHYDHLKVISVANDGVHLERKPRSSTLWSFVEI